MKRIAMFLLVFVIIGLVGCAEKGTPTPASVPAAPPATTRPTSTPTKYDGFGGVVACTYDAQNKTVLMPEHYSDVGFSDATWYQNGVVIEAPLFSARGVCRSNGDTFLFEYIEAGKTMFFGYGE